MTVMIVEDELASQEILKALLHEFFPAIQVLAVASTVAAAVPLVRKHRPDLIFLDIELPMEDGFALLTYFPNAPFKVVFTTAYEEYAIRAFRISAVDYLLKPIELDELREAITKAQQAAHPKPAQQFRLLRDNYLGQSPKLSLATNEGYLFIKINEIIRCQADGRYTVFHLQDGSKYLTAKNIGEFEETLHPFQFMRVHRSQIINLNKITKFLKGKPAEVVMEDHTKVQVSNSHREALLSFLGLL
ncbi:MAG: LytTR family DNA-binding domain-containing protein [Bacteroidota bacterium]